MKIIFRAGNVFAQAEDLADIKTLLALNGEKKMTLGKKSSWKGKHRIPCPTCGKKCKNLKLHTRWTHTPKAVAPTQ